MSGWKWATVVAAIASMAAIAVVAVGALGEADPADDLEGAVGSSLVTPSELPEWTPGTAPEGSVPTTTAAPAEQNFVFAEGATIDPEDADVVIHVDPEAGSDENSGLDPASPFSTVTRALEAASEFRLEGRQVRVVLAPGIYRETIEIIQDPDDSPLLVIEAAESGQAIISGADVWTDWSWDAEAEAFVHEWPFDWSPAEGVDEIVGRREMVIVEGERLTQVLSVSELDDGTFTVDTEADVLYMLPPAGSAFAGLAAEVAVRERPLNLDSARNVVIRGLTIRHAPNPFESSAVRISNSTNVVFDSNRVVENSWTGLGLSTSNALTLRGNVINENGGGGVGMFQIRDVVFEDNDTSLNNWRGVRGDYVGWSIGGIKAVGVQEIVIRRHRAWWNATRGLWLDFDVNDVSVEDSSWCNNLTDGLFIEAVPGPVRVIGSEACENGRYGFLIVNVYGGTIRDNRICGNGEAQIHMNAESGGREVNTSNGVIVMSAARDLTLVGNVVTGDGVLLDIGIPRADFAELVPTLTADSNTWRSTAEGGVPFSFPGGEGALDAWQDATGQEADSTWELVSEDSCSAP